MTASNIARWVLAAVVAVQTIVLVTGWREMGRQREGLDSLRIALNAEITARRALETQMASISPSQQALTSPTSPDSISAIFSESPPLAPEAERKLNALKKQYEDALVLHFFLAKCGKSGVEDYHTINSNLSQDMATLNAPGRLQYDVMTAAKGSYESIYAHTPCDGPQADASAEAFRSYIATLTERKNVSVP